MQLHDENHASSLRRASTSQVAIAMSKVLNMLGIRPQGLELKEHTWSALEITYENGGIVHPAALWPQIPDSSRRHRNDYTALAFYNPSAVRDDDPAFNILWRFVPTVISR
jgi:hypothetical protein